MRPRISILMPVWNGEDYLAEALASVLEQSFTDFELLVMDDGSTDGTSEILAACRDPRLRVFRLDHAGIVVALNYGLSQAQSEWIARQDADDLSHPDRLMRQWAAISANPRAVLCHTDVELFGAGSSGIRTPRFSRSKALLALRLCFQCPITHSSVLFNKSAAVSAGGYRAEERHAEDFSLWGRLLEKGDVIGLPEQLLKLRVHSGSISHQKRDVQMALTREIAVAHCSRFMNLPPADAERAFRALTEAREDGDWSEWRWFLFHCLPKLRWKSAEALAWIAVQTARIPFKRRSR